MRDFALSAPPGALRCQPSKQQSALESLWTCPACKALNVERHNGCGYCSYQLPPDQHTDLDEPTAAIQYRPDFGTARVSAIASHGFPWALVAVMVTGLGAIITGVCLTCL
jgi:hypothetical protein